MALVIRAALALLLGVVALFMLVLAIFIPRTTTVLVVQIFAGYALLDGLLSLGSAVGAVRRGLPRWLIILEGLIEVATSIAVVIIISGDRPHGIPTLVALWAIATGILQMAWTFALDIRRGRGLLILAAALSLAFGVLALGWRPPDLLTAVWRLAVYALLLGILRLAGTFRIRGPQPGACTLP